MPVTKISPEEVMKMATDKGLNLDAIKFPREAMCTTLERKCLASLAYISGLYANSPRVGGCKYYLDRGGYIANTPTKYANYLEFGTWRGFSAAVLDQCTVSNKVYTIDMPQEMAKNLCKHQTTECLPTNEIGGFCKEIGARNVEYIFKDSLELDLKKDTYIESACFSFIDGNHSPDHTLHDFIQTLNVMVEGGIVALHNYNINHRVGKDGQPPGFYVEDGPNNVVEQYDHLAWFWIENTVIIYTKL